MTGKLYETLCHYMESCMGDSAHDTQHVYRVLWNALRIAEGEQNVDLDILICACLLHDIGRPEQFADPTICHAEAGAQKAYAFLLNLGLEEAFSRQVRHCIAAHRFSKRQPPQTIEAKILFDADKLDVTGLIGIARTLQYQGRQDLPLYTLSPDGSPSDGTNTQDVSFFHEYHRKLAKLYDTFYTATGAALAEPQRRAAQEFYEKLYAEVSQGFDQGKETLERILQ